MTIAVFDTNVIYSALYFGGKPLLCLEAVSLGLCRPAFTDEMFSEYEEILPNPPRGARLYPNIPRWIEWFKLGAIQVIPAELAGISSRDLKDNPFLACAVAACADFLVSGDDDLLSVTHPFEFQIVTPTEFLGQFPAS